MSGENCPSLKHLLTSSSSYTHTHTHTHTHHRVRQGIAHPWHQLCRPDESSHQAAHTCGQRVCPAGQKHGPGKPPHPFCSHFTHLLPLPCCYFPPSPHPPPFILTSTSLPRPHFSSLTPHSFSPLPHTLTSPSLTPSFILTSTSLLTLTSLSLTSLYPSLPLHYPLISPSFTLLHTPLHPNRSSTP